MTVGRRTISRVYRGVHRTCPVPIHEVHVLDREERPESGEVILDVTSPEKPIRVRDRLHSTGGSVYRIVARDMNDDPETPRTSVIAVREEP